MNLVESILKNKPNNLIRIQESEYDEVPVSGLFAHFNLGVAPHVPGDVYVLPQIMKSGHTLPDGGEVAPQLSFEDVRVAKCVGVKTAVPFDQVSAEDFAHSMSGIKDVESLKERIFSRYHQSRPQLSDEEILAIGVTVTTLEILDGVASASLIEKLAIKN